MKILFVVPNFPKRIKEYLILPSLELCIMSSELKSKGHTVNLIDMKIDQLSEEDYETVLSEYNPDIICIDDIPEVHCNSKKIINISRKLFPNSLITMRGELCSFEPKMILERNPNLDVVLRYETDYTLTEIIEHINSNKSFDDIKNIGFRKNGEIIITEIRKQPIDLDSLSMPDRKLYNIKKYLLRDSETIVKSSRGCPGNCLFCIKTRFESFRIFSMKRFCDEIEELQKYGFKSFFFSDDTFAFSMKRLNDFAEEVKRRNLKIKWTSNLRIKDITDEKIKLMKELGAYRVFVGIETINKESSKEINKNLDPDFVREKIKILKKYDMQFHASFILGNPNDSEEDLEETIKFVKEIKPTLVTFNLIKIYPGLDLYNNPEKYGMIIPDKYWFEKDDWASKVVMGTKKLPPEVLEKWSRRLLLEFIND